MIDPTGNDAGAIMSPSGSEAFYGFAGVAITTVLTQWGLAWRARRRASVKKEKDTAVILENKDNRAFQFLVGRLDQCEKAHQLCEQRADKMSEAQGLMSRQIDMARYSIEVLTGCLKRAGIEVPPLPKIEAL
jgi:hypothetical protein